MEQNKRLKLMRTAKGYTQMQLANECGISTVTVVNIEKGYSAGSGSTWAKISKVLGVSASYLLGLTDKMEE